MSITDIERVWGSADEFSLELTKDNGWWVCSLPPDLVDGQYSVQLFAMRRNGMTGMWTGTLYIADGVRCLHLKQERFTLFLLPEQTKINALPPRVSIEKCKECCVNV